MAKEKNSDFDPVCSTSENLEGAISKMKISQISGLKSLSGNDEHFQTTQFTILKGLKSTTQELKAANEQSSDVQNSLTPYHRPLYLRHSISGQFNSERDKINRECNEIAHEVHQKEVATRQFARFKPQTELNFQLDKQYLTQVCFLPGNIQNTSAYTDCTLQKDYSLDEFVPSQDDQTIILPHKAVECLKHLIVDSEKLWKFLHSIRGDLTDADEVYCGASPSKFNKAYDFEQLDEDLRKVWNNAMQVVRDLLTHTRGLLQKNKQEFKIPVKEVRIYLEFVSSVKTNLQMFPLKMSLRWKNTNMREFINFVQERLSKLIDDLDYSITSAMFQIRTFFEKMVSDKRIHNEVGKLNSF